MANEQKCVLMLALRELSKGTSLDPASKLLLRVGQDILSQPNDPQRRTVQASCLFPETSGALEVLLVVGFCLSEDGEGLRLAPDQNEIDALTADLLSVMVNYLEAEEVSRVLAPQMNEKASSNPGPMMQRLHGGCNNVAQYESPAVQDEIMKAIPLATLEQRALVGAEKLPGRDQLCRELLHWFKREFFTWMNAPPCMQCGGPTKIKGMAQATAEEARWGAGRVEAYTCEKCPGIHTRFPRYNNPAKLATTRTGRCGEWANCFTACCRALGFEARWVLDLTDHVWTEVYSDSQKRWIHCDSCEDCWDSPLLYEQGWGKKLTYVIAFSRDDVSDVTWRYSKTREATLQRRTECKEAWLAESISDLRAQARDRCRSSTARRATLDSRALIEAYEFASRRAAAETQHLSGRISGDLAWRLSRGETKLPEAVQETKEKAEAARGFVFAPATEELPAGKYYRVRYSAGSDNYLVGKEKIHQGFSTCAWECRNIMRKEEMDWKQVYLARATADPAQISWRLCFKNVKASIPSPPSPSSVLSSVATLSIDNPWASSAPASAPAVSAPPASSTPFSYRTISSVFLRFQASKYHSGRITLKVHQCDGSLDEPKVLKTLEVDIPGPESFVTAVKPVAGCGGLIVEASMEGGDGDSAWQHTQLFRQGSGEEAFHFDLLCIL